MILNTTYYNMNNYKINNANVEYEFIWYIHLQFSIIFDYDNPNKPHNMVSLF